jgi:hypothetical protein
MNNSKIEKLEKQRANIQRRINRIKAENCKKQRREDTRRKILVGTAILETYSKTPGGDAMLKALMDNSLKNDRDRELFDLPPMEE